MAKTFCVEVLDADVRHFGHCAIVAGLTDQTIKVEAIGWAVQRMGCSKDTMRKCVFVSVTFQIKSRNTDAIGSVLLYF